MKKNRKSRRKYSPSEVSSVRLLNAVGDWVNANGGNALVAGDIGIMDDPARGIFSEGLDSLRFYVVIKVTGKRPVKPEVRA